MYVGISLDGVTVHRYSPGDSWSLYRCLSLPIIDFHCSSVLFLMISDTELLIEKTLKKHIVIILIGAKNVGYLCS